MHSDRCEMISHCRFYLHLPDLWCWASLHVSVSHLFVFGKMPAQVLYSFIKEKDLCIYFWPRWVFITACRLLQLGSGGCLSCGVQASRCGGFACCRAQSRACAFSSCGSRALERWLSGCGARAQLLCSVWDPPGSGFKSVSPALAGGFLTIRSPGKSSAQFFNWVAFGFLILSFMSSLCTLDFNPYESARLLQWVVFSFCW